MEQQIDMNESGAKPNTLDFDRYDIIGLLLMMYGWWKILDQSWLFAFILFAIGWLLAFGAQPRRDAFVRVIGGISADVFNATRSLCRRALNYIAEKGKDKSSNNSK